MVIRSLEKTYEVIQQLREGDTVSHFLCREADGDPETLWDVAEFSGPGQMDQVILGALEMKENPAFTDFVDYFPDGERVCLVFTYLEGQALCEMTVGLMPMGTRFELVQKILEKILMMDLSVFLMWDVMKLNTIRAAWTGKEEAPFSDVGFFYGLENLGAPGEITEIDVWDRLGEIVEFLFEGELESGRYPEIKKFLKSLYDGQWGNVMDVYQAWLMLLPVVSEDRKPVKAVKEPWTKRLGRWKKQILGAVKLAVAVTIMINACLLVAAGWKNNIFPVIQSAYLVRTMECDAKAAEGYSGRVKLLKPGTDRVIWKGTMEEGKLTGYGIRYYDSGEIEYEGMLAAGTYSGQGIFYDRNGTVLYEGNFLDGAYDGSGKLYDRAGNLRYQGGFVQGEKEGNGTFYGADGGLMYEGSFVKGQYDGEGKLYRDGSLVYEGGFKDGKAEGEGTWYEDGKVVEEGRYKAGKLEAGVGCLYDEDGVLSYQGGLEGGMRSGEGTAFEHGVLVYEGSFAGDAYDGAGKLYSPNTGGLIYEGGFSRGQFSGDGVMYEPVSGLVLYEGTFRLGFYDGAGKEYDDQGNPLYEGEFRLGSKNGNGVLYDPATGKVLQEGIFRDGVFVTSKEELEAAGKEDGAEDGQVQGGQSGDGPAKAGGDDSAKAGQVKDGQSGDSPAKTGGGDSAKADQVKDGPGGDGQKSDGPGTDDKKENKSAGGPGVVGLSEDSEEAKAE